MELTWTDPVAEQKGFGACVEGREEVSLRTKTIGNLIRWYREEVLDGVRGVRECWRNRIA